MSTRLLLCVEPDEAALSVIVGTLEPYGFEIKNITNGDQVVDWAKKQRPTLMLVSVEPKKSGYAICNKIKRNAELKEIPLILTSSDESPDKFEQHKTFKLRADDYMFKPLDRHELMRKVNVLVGLDEPDASGTPSISSEIFVGTDVVSSEIAIDADDIVDESKLATPPPQQQEGEQAPAGDPLGVSPVLDAMFDKEADAAVDALDLSASASMEEESPNMMKTMPGATNFLGMATPPPVEPQATEEGQEQPPPVDSEADEWGEDSATRAAPSALAAEHMHEMLTSEQATDIEEEVPTTINNPPEKVLEVVSEAPAPPAEVEGNAEQLREDQDDFLPSPDEVRSTSVVAYATVGANDAMFSDLQKRVHDLEDEKRELASVIEDLRTHLQAQPLHKEKDLLGLRETINRKEKDILDLRDALDAKDRQLLDQKDRMREHERARRDLEEKMLAFEKNLMHANEKVIALAQDKEKAIERERGLKVRLEDAHSEIGKNHDELDQLKKRLGSAEDRARQEIDRARSDLEARIAEEQETHRAEIARLREDREAEKAAREAEVQTEISKLNASHAAEIEMLNKRHGEEKASLDDGHEIELARVRREHEKALLTQREEHNAALENEKRERQAAIEAKDRDAKNEIAEVRRSNEDALTEAEERRKRELEEAEARRTTDIDAADVRRRTELQARDEQHHAATAELERRHLAEKTELVEKQRVDLEQAHGRASQIEADLAARNEELAETHRRLLRVEGELDTARADVRDREVKLSQTRDRISDLEGKLADLEDQVLRAYRRIKDDEKTIDKAKRAVSVALTLLDERGSGSSSSPPPRNSEEPQQG